MKTTLRVGLLMATALLSFPALAEDTKHTITPSAEAPANANKDFTILKISNEEIKNSDVLEVWKGLFPGSTAPDFATFDEHIRQNVLRGMISEKLIYREAIKSGFDKNEDVKKRLEALQKQVLMQSFIENKAKTLVTDEQLKAAYQEKTATAKGQEELKAHHILVATEEEAKKILEQIKKGGDFEKIAKEKSTDSASGTNGGDLGWFTKDKMVPAFADAAFKLKKGELSAPVKSEFGWHIIKLDDRRPIKPASFEESKEALKGEIANKAVQSYVEGLLKTADIKYYDANGKEKEFSRELSTNKKASEETKPADEKAVDAKPADEKTADVKTEEKKEEKKQ